MSFLKTIWKKGDLVNAKDFNRYEDTFVEHDTKLPVLDEELAPRTDVDAELNLKANKEAVDGVDAGQATKTEMAGAIEPKQQTEDFNGRSLLKADTSYVTEEDQKRASKVELADTFEPKADKSYVDEEDALLLVKTEMESELASKADKRYVDDQDALKADKSYVLEQDMLLASKAALTDGFAPKADKTYVEDENGKLASKTEVSDAAMEMVEAPYVVQEFNEVKELLVEEQRQNEYIDYGLSVLNGDTAGPLSAEIEGKTLVSRGNSNLKEGKMYVLSEPKMKVIVDGEVKSGISKFTKKTTTKTSADFNGKVSGSTVENPHTFYHLHSADENRSFYDAVENVAGYSYIISENGQSAISGMNVIEGAFGAHYFSFDVLEQVERSLGNIPRESKDDKVQWLKDNVESLTLHWHGMASSHTDNLATVSRWVNGIWGTPISREAASKIQFTYDVTRTGGIERPAAFIGSTNDGLIHFRVNASPTDAITKSIVATDYVRLEISLKKTAELNTRAILYRVEDFKGKVEGSLTENPHKASHSTVNDRLILPGEFHYEPTQNYYDYLKSPDGEMYTSYRVGEGYIAQQLFSFNVVEAIERNIGKIPTLSFEEKVLWVRKNATKITAFWSGYGKSPSGNMVSLKRFLINGWTSTGTRGSHSESFVKEINTSSSSNYGQYVTDDGFFHVLAHAEPSDGVMESGIRTDYVRLEIEISKEAKFHSPRVPLYEVGKDAYDKVLVEWTAEEVMKRYPVVEGVTSLNNPYLLINGGNLLPSLLKVEKTNMNLPDFTVETDSEIRFVATANSQGVIFKVQTIPGQTYSFSAIIRGRMYILEDDWGGAVVSQYYSDYSGENDVFKTFSATSKTTYIRIDTATGQAGTEYVIKNPMLNLGEEYKPYTPQNPAHLYINEALGEMGGQKDVLFKENGKWKVSRKIEKDIVYDENLLIQTYSHSALPPATKGYQVFNLFKGKGRLQYGNYLLKRPDGSVIDTEFQTTSSEEGIFGWSGDDGHLYGYVPDRLTGIPSTREANTQDIRRYFNGWKYTDGIVWVSVTGSGETANAETALIKKPLNYQPYELSYVLGEPVVEEAVFEGDLSINGKTQVELNSGIVVREKAVINQHLAGFAYVFNGGSSSSKYAKHRVLKFLHVYEGTKEIPFLVNTSTTTENGQPILIENEDIDPAAEHYVTYLVDEKDKFTVNPEGAKVTYARNLRSAHDDLSAKISDTTSMLTVHERSLVDLYTRLRALEAN